MGIRTDPMSMHKTISLQELLEKIIEHNCHSLLANLCFRFREAFGTSSFMKHKTKFTEMIHQDDHGTEYYPHDEEMIQIDKVKRILKLGSLKL